MGNTISNNWILKVIKLSAKFGENCRAIFQEISFEIPKYCIYGIFGATGCGKSTLAQTIIGFVPNHYLSGKILLSIKNEQINLLDKNIDWKTLRGKKIVYVPQDTYKNLNPYEKIFQQLQRVYEQTQKNNNVQDIPSLSEIIKMVQLDFNLLEYYPYNLSAGLRQRCALACAFAAQPELLILDEPMSAMDHHGRIHLMETLETYSKSHTVLLISHENPQYHSMIPKENRFYFPISDLLSSNIESTARLPTTSFPKQSTPRLPTLSFTKQITPRIPTIAMPIVQENTKFNYGDISVNNQKQNELLRLDNITKIWDGYIVFERFNFSMQTGQWLYFEGHNGCGKTTLLNIMLGIVRPEEGNFFWKNQIIPWKKLKQNSQRYIHSVFQDVYTSFNPRRTVAQTLEEISEQIPTHHRWEIETYRQKLWDDFELPSFLWNSFPWQLSYGQQKRLAILRCLLEYRRSQLIYGGEHLLVLDEALSGIHRELRKKMIDILFDFKAQHSFSIIWVAHEDIALKDICDTSYNIAKMAGF